MLVKKGKLEKSFNKILLKYKSQKAVKSGKFPLGMQIGVKNDDRVYNILDENFKFHFCQPPLRYWICDEKTRRAAAI